MNEAAAPVPLALPMTPAVPAKVVTTPVVEILRIVQLLVSATKTLPPVSTTTPRAKLKRAAVPVALVVPGTPGAPASVVMPGAAAAGAGLTAAPRRAAVRMMASSAAKARSLRVPALELRVFMKSTPALCVGCDGFISTSPPQ